MGSWIRRHRSRRMLVHKKSCFFLFILNLRNTNVWAQSEECGSGPLKPEVVWETKNSAGFAAEKVFVNDTSYWLAERGKTADQGFTIKVDSCARWIYGCKLKNLDSGHTWQTKGFRVLGSLSENGPFDTLVEGELKDTRHGTWPAVEFSFENPVQLQFIKFELISYWRNGGALYYFAPVPGRAPVDCKVTVWTDWSSCCNGKSGRSRTAIVDDKCKEQSETQRCT